jgi:hypothetical protein
LITLSGKTLEVLADRLVVVSETDAEALRLAGWTLAATVPV